MAITAFKPVLWEAELLVNFRNDLVYEKCCNRNYEGSVKNKGDSVRLTSIGPVSTYTYSQNTDISGPDALQDDAMTLVIDQGDYFNFAVDDVDKRQAAGDFVSEAMREASWSLGNLVDSYLSSAINNGVPSANQVGAVTCSTDPADENMYEIIADLKLKLDKQNAPMGDRWLVGPPEMENLLIKDGRFVSFGTDANRAVLRGDAIGRIAGFQVMLSNQAPTSGAAYYVIAGSKTGVTFAMQITKTEAYRPEKRFADAVKGLQIYGAKVTRPFVLANALVTFA